MQKIKLNLLNVPEQVADIVLGLADLGFNVQADALDERAEITATREFEGESSDAHTVH